nr:2OG-Fe dioxygenase family protein [Bartonella sp. MM73XJBT]
MFVNIDKVVEELRENKFSHIASKEVNIRANEIADLARLNKSWDYLPLDPYMKEGDTYRRRCFGKFIVDIANKTIDFLDDNIFFKVLKSIVTQVGSKDNCPKCQMRYHRMLYCTKSLEVHLTLF